ncbi:UxaA family hydrolase [Desulfosporosinus sp.]|uniref:UxaA family hydrolase n=1 Tax=Desulfosporosinus sp. TaxID=157907 RepID=UPI000E9126E5|nr:UxaA family hydrolase [Desulfosporosinus sp.]MBC2722208.1 UxaA family hydrolase [Desulfosporosinus sp.]MBC2728546.1 UxaA family hydrolase [Desulfosporosinus sp.]HBV86206.1 D-galactarate dehydratase [Desulfosporosinus sp.]
MKKQAVVINPNDNVATVVDDFPVNTIIHFYIGQSEHSLQLLQDIPLGHKVAIQEIKSGEAILKYAEPIGVATELIRPGQHVHVHNLESQRGRKDK